MGLHKSLKIALYCTVLFLIIGGIIAVAGQTKFGDKANTAAIQQTPGPGQIIMPGGYIINESDQEKYVIKRGTVHFKLSRTNSTIEHQKDLDNLSGYLIKLLNVTPGNGNDEGISVGCISDNCTYEVIKPMVLSK